MFSRTTKVSIWLLAAISVILGLAVLCRRNFYEDEWTTLGICSRPYRDILHWSLNTDVHPPGVYLVDRFLLGFLKTKKVVGAVHFVVWSSGALFFVVSFMPLLRSEWGRVHFAAVALMHPHVMMWNTSLRWCAFWWGPALAVIALALGPSMTSSSRRWRKPVGLGAGIGVLTYFDYLTLLLMVCLIPAWLIRHGVARASLARLAALAGTAMVVALPLVLPLLTILARGGPPLMDPPRLAALRMAHVMTIGDAILPWHPVGLVVILGLFMPSAWLIVRRNGCCAAFRSDPKAVRVWASLGALLCMLAVGIVIGFGSRGYTSLGLTPIAALGLICGAEQQVSAPWRLGASFITAIWIGTGAHNLLTRSGTAKRQFNDHPEEMIAQLQEVTGNQPAVVVTDDAVLTFEINELRAQHSTTLVTCSPIADDVHGYPAGTAVDIASYPYVIVVEHPEGVRDIVAQHARPAIDCALHLLSDPRVLPLGEDPDWEWKNRLAGAGIFPARLRATYGRPLPGDWAGVREQMGVASRFSILGTGMERSESSIGR